MFKQVPLYLARQNVSEGWERVIESLVIDALVQVLDEDVSDTGLADGWVTLGPHDTTWPTLDCIKVHCIQCSFSCKSNDAVTVYTNFSQPRSFLTLITTTKHYKPEPSSLAHMLNPYLPQFSQWFILNLTMYTEETLCSLIFTRNSCTGRYCWERILAMGILSLSVRLGCHDPVPNQAQVR